MVPQKSVLLVVAIISCCHSHYEIIIIQLTIQLKIFAEKTTLSASIQAPEHTSIICKNDKPNLNT